MEIKAGNASQIGNEFGQVNVNPSLAVNSLSGLNTYQSLEHKDDFVDANEEASDFVEDSSGCGLGFVEYRHRYHPVFRQKTVKQNCQCARNILNVLFVQYTTSNGSSNE